MPDSAALAAAARNAQGIAQALPGGGAPDVAGASTADLLQALKSGQFSVQALLQLIAALTNAQLPNGAPQSPDQGDQGGAPGGAIAQAFLGQ